MSWRRYLCEGDAGKYRVAKKLAEVPLGALNMIFLEIECLNSEMASRKLR